VGMMLRRCDRLNVLETFKAVARHVSFRLFRATFDHASLTYAAGMGEGQCTASDLNYRTKYIRRELPRTTSPMTGTINNQLVHTRSANRDGT
jgi:hypothetical protein